MDMSRLRLLADDIWCAEDELRTGLGVVFPVRMTVLRDASGLTLVSPIAIDDPLAASLAELGEVRALVAPNAMHHVYLPAAIERYPEARVFGVPGLRKKCPNVVFDEMLADGPAPFHAGIELHTVAGAPPMDERVLFHAETRTLIVTDLIFNIPSPANWISKIVFKYVARALGRPGQSRLWRTFTKDRGAAGHSAARLLELDFDRLVMAHGDVVVAGGREVLAECTTWMRDGMPAQLPAPA